MIGKNVGEITVPQLSVQTAAEIMEALRHGKTWSGGFAVQQRDGEVIHALVTDAGIYRDGDLIGIVGQSLNLGDAVRPSWSAPATRRSSSTRTTWSAPAPPSRSSSGGRATGCWAPLSSSGSIPRTTRPWSSCSSPTRPARARRGSSGGRRGDWPWVEMAVTDLTSRAPAWRRGLQHPAQRAAGAGGGARAPARGRAPEVPQDLFATTLELDRLLSRAGPHLQPRIDAARDSVARAIATLREVVAARVPGGTVAASATPPVVAREDGAVTPRGPTRWSRSGSGLRSRSAAPARRLARHADLG